MLTTFRHSLVRVEDGRENKVDQGMDKLEKVQKEQAAQGLIVLRSQINKEVVFLTLIFIATIINVIMNSQIARINKKNNVTETLLKTLVRKLERKNAHQGKIITFQTDQTIST
ncbi:hypothetical protein L3Y34_013413 [Caenorhabditis briggsae]|uniref:Uncharacterized protein n=1 Tax=Caenorhabditis briggsae TaxID=6238 RepID=A0AAE9A1K6_CAEBR|nr:hypothetical protein L3Y34_013413 [Caenorhabditis briggsae]